MTIGEFIYNRRKKLGLTLEQVGNFVGVGKSTVKKWETGYIANIKRDKISKLANILQVDPIILINNDINIDKELKYPLVSEETTIFPVIGEIVAEYENIALENWSGETIEIPNSYLKGKNKNDFFILKVKDSSIYPRNQNSNIVLISKQNIIKY